MSTGAYGRIRVEPDAGTKPGEPRERGTLTDTGRMVDDETSVGPGDELLGSRINPHMIGDAGIGSHLDRRTEPDPGAYPGARTNERAFLYMRICPDNRLGTQLRSRVEGRIGSQTGTGSQPCAFTHGSTRAYTCARTDDGIGLDDGAGPNRSSRLDARGRSDVRRRMNPSTIGKLGPVRSTSMCWRSTEGTGRTRRLVLQRPNSDTRPQRIGMGKRDAIADGRTGTYPDTGPDAGIDSHVRMNVEPAALSKVRGVVDDRTGADHRR